MPLSPPCKKPVTLIILLAFCTVLLAALYNGPGSNLLLLSVVVGLVLTAFFKILISAVYEKRLHFHANLIVGFVASWFVWLLSSSWWSHFPQLSYYYAWTIGILPLTFIVWLHVDHRHIEWHLIRRGLLFAGFIIASIGLMQYVMTGKRVTGPMLDFNSYAAVLYLLLMNFIPKIFYLNTSNTGNFKKLFLPLGLFFFITLALFATYSRGGIGTFLILSAIFYLFARRRYPRHVQSTALLVLLSLIAYGLVKIYPQHMLDRTWDLATDSSFQARLMMWHSMWEIIKQHPWTGTGIATFKLFYPAFRNPLEAGSAGDLGHNDYLQFLQGQGPIGLLFLLGLGVIALAVAWRLFQRRQDSVDISQGEATGEAFGLSLGVIGLFIHATVNFIFYVQPLSLLAGLFLAQAYRTAYPIKFRIIHLPTISPTIAAAGLACVMGLPVGGLFLDGIATTVIQNQGNLPYVRNIAHDPEAVYHFASFMEPLRPKNVVIRNVLAKHELAVALDKNASPFARAAAAQGAEQNLVFVMRAKGDRDAGTLTSFALLAEAFPGLQSDHPFGWKFTPDNLLKHAIRYDPMYFPAYRLLAQRYAKAGHPERALKLITHKAFKWYGVAVVGAQPQRVKLTALAIKLSEQVGQHGRAKALARNLLQNDPTNQVARQALESPSKSSDTFHKQRLQQ